MANYRITILKGNDIGLEIVPVAVETVKTSVGRYSDIGIEWVELPIGYSSYRENGETLPKTIEALYDTDGCILGPIRHMAYQSVINCP